MKNNFKYEIGHEFYLLDADNFHKAKITKREKNEHNFYYLEIENRKGGWYTENFIYSCAFTEEEMLKKLKEIK